MLMMPFGRRLEIPPFRGSIHPDYETPEFLRAIADCRALAGSPEARILLDARNRVAAVPIPVSASFSVDAVIKEFRASGFKKFKTLFWPGKAFRAWRGAVACLERRVPTPLPLAYLERRERGVVAESYFVSAHIDGAVEIREMLRTLPPEDLTDLLADLAKFLLFCHNEGILHRDLSDGNILVRTEKGRARSLFLVDTNRISLQHGEIPFPARIRNLVRIGVPPDFRDLFLGFYLGEGRDRKSLRFWYSWNKTVYTRFVAFKKKLRLRRLAEKLRFQ